MTFDKKSQRIPILCRETFYFMLAKVISTVEERPQGPLLGFFRTMQLFWMFFELTELPSFNFLAGTKLFASIDCSLDFSALCDLLKTFFEKILNKKNRNSTQFLIFVLQALRITSLVIFRSRGTDSVFSIPVDKTYCFSALRDFFSEKNDSIKWYPFILNDILALEKRSASL